MGIVVFQDMVGTSPGWWVENLKYVMLETCSLLESLWHQVIKPEVIIKLGGDYPKQNLSDQSLHTGQGFWKGIKGQKSAVLSNLLLDIPPRLKPNSSNCMYETHTLHGDEAWDEVH